VVIIGQAKYVDDACQGGGGSSKVDPLYTVPPVEGMQDVLSGLGSDAVVSKVTVADDLSNLEEAKAAAAAADTVILMAGVVASEGEDRPSMAMADEQDRMIAEILGITERTVVVLKDSSPVLLPWLDNAPAVLEAWNQGAEDGHVVADLLFGVVNPCGKVPTTYPRTEDDTIIAGHPERHPGVDEGSGYPVIRYSEGLEVGYRWHQAQGIAPLYPFGYGLSYTSFELSGFSVTPTESDGAAPVTATVTVRNTGDCAGAEVVQVYLGIRAEGQPPKRLVGFQKVHLEPGDAREVTITVDPAATNHPFGVWDCSVRDFVVETGEYTVHVGTSSEDTPFTATVTVA
jgi:beta-glucosidase